MSDFVLDLRKREERTAAKYAAKLKYYEDMRVETYDFDQFTLVLSRPDDWTLWGPYRDHPRNIFVSIVGRIALEEEEWKRAEEIEGEGGLAAKHIYKLYVEGDINELRNLNGNYVVHIFDGYAQKLLIIIDRCGMFPCFMSENGGFILSSHPDILARVIGDNNKFDYTSMAEFLITGKVSHPFTYYKDITCLDYGTIFSIDLTTTPNRICQKDKYFNFDYNIGDSTSEQHLAEELADAFRKSIKRRELRRFGKTAIALSGGMDSRTFLCSAENPAEIMTFCFFDEENLEYKIAKSIAGTLGVEFVPLKRDFDYYGNSAEMAVKIYGGMGSFNNSHFIGFRQKFKELGISNIITGFYCDYFFKALAVDRHFNKYLRYQSLDSYKDEWYQRHYWSETVHSKKVHERLENLFPWELKTDNSPLGKLKIESRRIFPLCYEPDNAETTIAQKVLSWHLPSIDNDVISVYLKIPPQYKLNTSLFEKVVRIQCGDKISNIPDSNTGAKIDAPKIVSLAREYRLIASRKISTRIKKETRTEGSWPNWENYLKKSSVIRSLWERNRKVAKELFIEITGSDPYDDNLASYRGVRVPYFYRLLTLKLWLDAYSKVRDE